MFVDVENNPEIIRRHQRSIFCNGSFGIIDKMSRCTLAVSRGDKIRSYTLRLNELSRFKCNKLAVLRPFTFDDELNQHEDRNNRLRADCQENSTLLRMTHVAGVRLSVNSLRRCRLLRAKPFGVHLQHPFGHVHHFADVFAISIRTDFLGKRLRRHRSTNHHHMR